jgi:hypothetical protein
VLVGQCPSGHVLNAARRCVDGSTSRAENERDRPGWLLLRHSRIIRHEEVIYKRRVCNQEQCS